MTDHDDDVRDDDVRASWADTAGTWASHGGEQWGASDDDDGDGYDDESDDE